MIESQKVSGKSKPGKDFSPTELNSSFNDDTDKYQYGAGIRKLKPGIEVEGGSGKAYSDIYVYTGTSTGSWSYTGVGFKPKVVRIQANLVESQGGSSDGTANGTMNACQYDYWSSMGVYLKSYRDNRLVFIPNNGYTTIKAATLTSMDSDGFTLNFSTNNALNAQFIITCWG